MDKINFVDGDVLYASQLNAIQDNTEDAIANAGGTFYVKITEVQSPVCSADHTPQEIYQAYTNGKSVYALCSVEGAPFALPLLVAINDSGNYTFGFAGTGSVQYMGSPKTVCVAYSNDIWFKWETELKKSEEGNFICKSKDVKIRSNEWQSSTRGYECSSVYATGDSTNYPTLITPKYSSNLETALAEREAYSLICDANIDGSGKLTLYCFEEKPSVDLTLHIEGFISTT